MAMTLGGFVTSVIDTLRAPKEAARWVMSFDMTRGERWMALFLVVLLSVILQQATTMLFPQTVDSLLADLLSRPLTVATIQMSIMVLLVFAIYWIGRARGGTGDFGDAILLLTWVQCVLVFLQVLQTIFLFLMPPLAGLLGVLGIFVFFWLLTNFIAELHGFKSLGLVFAMIVLSGLGIAFGMALIMSLIGIAAPGV